MPAVKPDALDRASPPGIVRDGRIPIASPAMPRASDLAPYLERIDSAGWYSNFGPLVMEFEARLAARFSPGTCIVTLANGTLALTLALEAMSLPKGSVCALPSWTFVATAHAVSMAGLVPWFVDVHPETGELTPEGLIALLPQAPGPVTAAIPVAPMGRPMDSSAWRDFQDATGVKVVIDSAAGFDSAASAKVPVMVSLHATKTLGVGEGGFIASEDPEFSARLRAMTNFAFLGDRVSRHVATNAKLSEYAAAVGLAALDRWPATRNRYLAAARRLRIALSDAQEVTFQEGWGVDWISSTCLVRLPPGSAARVEAALEASGIDTRRWWGSGCHLAPAFRDCPTGDLTATETLAASTLGLPFFADLSAEQIHRTAWALRGALAGLQSQISRSPPHDP
jgi:dTDP-4-amino-4,6-dideoxygalactose transaminase